MPLFQGAGIKVKVIEALACGTPIIGTDIAFEGLPTKYTRMMVLSNNKNSFASNMHISMSLQERIQVKKEFIADYTSETIPQFLMRLLS